MDSLRYLLPSRCGGEEAMNIAKIMVVAQHTELSMQDIKDLCMVFGFDMSKDDKGQAVIYTNVYDPPEQKKEEKHEVPQ
jgi:hypothetical protein